MHHLASNNGSLVSFGLHESHLFCYDVGLQDIMFEGDLEVMFKHLTTSQPSLAAFGHIVNDARSLVAKLRRVSFSQIKHKGNVVANKLAILAKCLYVLKIQKQSNCRTRRKTDNTCCSPHMQITYSNCSVLLVVDSQLWHVCNSGIARVNSGSSNGGKVCYS